MKQIIILFFLILGFQTIVSADNNRINIKNKSGNTPVKKNKSCTNWSNEDFANWIEFGSIPDWITKDSSLVYNKDWFIHNQDYRILTYSQCSSAVSYVRKQLLLPMIEPNISALSVEIRKFNHYKYTKGQLTGNYRDTTGVLLEVICEPRDQYPTFAKEKTETDMGYLGYDLGSDVCHNFRPVPIFIEKIELELDSSSQFDHSNDEYDHSESDERSDEEKKQDRLTISRINGDTKKVDEQDISDYSGESQELTTDKVAFAALKKQQARIDALNKLNAEKAEKKALALARLQAREEAKLKAKIKAESDNRAKLLAQLKEKADAAKKAKDKANAISRAKAEYDAKIKEIKKTFN